MSRRGPRLPRRAPGGALRRRPAPPSRRLGRCRSGRRSRWARAGLESLSGVAPQDAAHGPRRRPIRASARLTRERGECRVKGLGESSARWSSEARRPRIGPDRAPFRGAFATLHFSTSTRGRSVDPGVDSIGRARGSRGCSAWTSRRSSTVLFHRSKMLWTSVDDRRPAHGSSTGRSLLPTHSATTEAPHDASVAATDPAFLHNPTCPLLRRRIL